MKPEDAELDISQLELTLIWAALWAAFGQRGPLTMLTDAELEHLPELLYKFDSWKHNKEVDLAALEEYVKSQLRTTTAAEGEYPHLALSPESI